MKDAILKIKESSRLSACADYISILKLEGVEIDALSLTNEFLDDINKIMAIAKVF